MAIVYPVADAELVAKLNSRLEEFRKLRVGYVDPTVTSEAAPEKKTVIKKVVKKKTFLQRFLFSDYE